MRKMIEEIVEIIIADTQRTIEGCTCRCADDFGYPAELVMEHKEDIIEALWEREEVSDAVWVERDKEFSLGFWLAYCPCAQ